MNIEEYKAHIWNSFLDAENNKSKCSEELLQMDGMTGKKTRHLYNNLLSMPNARYLEIGTWSGSSLCSAMYKNSIKLIYAVDDWSQFSNSETREIFNKNIKQFGGDNLVNFFETDFRKMDPKSMPKFNIYLYDAGHSIEDHYDSLKYMYDCLDDVFIFIVDDWNWPNIRYGTLKAIEAFNLEILFCAERRTTNDDSHPEGKLCGDFYWNGVCVFLLKKPSQKVTV